MNQQEYYDYVHGFWSKDLTHEQSVNNCILGITGEFLELMVILNQEPIDTEKVLDECGDVLYYIYKLFGTLEQLETLYNHKLVKAVTEDSTLDGNLAFLLGHLKKWNYHKKEFNVDAVIEVVKNLLNFLYYVYDDFGFDTEKVMGYNVSKLTNRFGGTTFQIYNHRKDKDTYQTTN